MGDLEIGFLPQKETRRKDDIVDIHRQATKLAATVLVLCMLTFIFIIYYTAYINGSPMTKHAMRQGLFIAGKIIAAGIGGSMLAYGVFYLLAMSVIFTWRRGHKWVVGLGSMGVVAALIYSMPTIIEGIQWVAVSFFCPP
jgi:hypothetical protein